MLLIAKGVDLLYMSLLCSGRQLYYVCVMLAALLSTHLSITACTVELLSRRRLPMNRLLLIVLAEQCTP